MNKRKILSIALAVAVLIFIMTISAFATAVTTEDNAVASIGSENYETIADAINAAKAGDTITLLADIESSTIVVINKAITLDGNGHKLTSTADRAINVDCDGEVTIKRLTINASGERAINVIKKPAVLKVENVTAVASNYTLCVAASSGAANVTVTGSDFTGLNVVNVAGAGSKIIVSDSKLTCNDQSLVENYAALILNADAVGATITATNVTFDIKGDSLKASSSAEGGEIVINGSSDVTNKAVAIIDYGNNQAYAFYSLEEAIAFANTGDVITLVDDVILEATLTIPAGKAITLDLNGKTISQSKECTESYEMISNQGTLTITGNGKISFTDTGVGNSSASWGAYTIRNTGTLVIENGTIENLSTQNVAGKPFAHTTLAIFQYSGSCTINGGTISCPSYRSVRLWKGEMVINGGAFVGQVWVQCVDETASLTINDGEFTNTWNDGSSVFVGNIDSNGKLYNTEIAITGGTFNGKVGSNNATAVSGVITGGTFSSKAMSGTNSALLANGFEFVENEDGTYSAAYSKVELSDIFTFKGYSVKENGTAIVASFNVNKELLEIYNTQNNAAVVFGSYFTAYEMSNPAIKTELSAKYSVTSTYDLIITEADGDNIDVPFIMAMYIEVGNETSYLSANGVGDAKAVQTISLAEALNYPVATKEEE